MSGPNDGGPAFPLHAGTPVDTVAELMGMSLRDWFAGQALAGCLSRIAPGSAKELAEVAYYYADAMIAARGVPTDETEARLLLGETLEVLRANGMGGTVLAERIRTVLQ